MSDIQKCQYCGHVYDANEEVHPACNKPQDERIKELEAKCPPRVWIHTLDRRSVVPVHALVHFEAEHEHHEYLSTEEHTAIVKGLEAKLTEARAEIERLREQVRLSSVCLKIQAGELLGAIREIDLDPSENWDEGFDSLQGIQSRLEIAATNAAEALARISALKATQATEGGKK